MFRILFIGTAVASLLFLSMPAGTFAQDATAKQDAKKAGSEAKDASASQPTADQQQNNRHIGFVP